MVINLLARFFYFLIGITPISLLKIWENFAYFIAKYLLRYRKNVVRKNLELAFPNQSDKYYKEIENDFYRYFVRNFVEMAKTGSLTTTQLKSLVHFSDLEEIKRFLNEGRSVILAFGHHNNWVWPMIVSELIDVPVYMVYQKLSNNHIDSWLRNNHCAPKVTYIEKKSTTRYFLKASKEKIPSIFMMVADQSPSADKGIYWADFFNIKTPFYRGLEFFGTKFNMPIFFDETLQIERYHYDNTLYLLYDGSELVEEGDITQRFANVLESAIRKQAGNYLWSHRRWKKVTKY